MSVEQILLNKGRNVVTIEPTKTLAQAAELLSSWKIGAVIVADALQPVSGIISERDIVRAISNKGASALLEPVSMHMTRQVVTCTKRADIPRIMEIMTTSRIRHVPVVEEGTLIGIISIGDVVKHRLAEIEAETQAIKEYIASA
ncbi:CBS domain-containing protein [Microvirga flavescens]|uniref:CBS domain-containing protein n=1 Tax=Microvirga flavescens TaxID=2249811 RepID=UPI000DD6D2FB|nr:CBS domain-containing protein [Microvirga flavescens]